jgi:exopolysaccharide production protein ExoQ
VTFARTVNSPLRFELAILTLTILALAGALAAFQPHGQVTDGPQTEVANISEAGDTAKQITLSFFYVVNVLLLIRFVRPWAWWFIGLPIAALLLWCFASIAWSEIPDGTLRRTVALAGPVVVGLYAGLRCDERRLTGILRIAAILTVGGSVIWAIAFRTYGFDTDGNMRGLFYHKNAFGLFLALCIVAVMYRICAVRERGLWNVLLLISLMACFVLSRSATPIVATGAAALSLLFVTLLQRSEGIIQSIVPWLVCAIPIVIVVAGSDLPTIVAPLLGRDTSLSGRTTIWDFVIPMIAKRPWLGYGYGIFWLGESSPAAVFWYWSKQFELHAHDGYLQLLLDVGAVGLALFAISLVMLLVRTIHLSRSGMAPLALWVTAFLAYFLVSNITDTELWQANSLLTTLYVWAVVRVNLESWRLSTLECTSLLVAPAHSIEQCANLQQGTVRALESFV